MNIVTQGFQPMQRVLTDVAGGLPKQTGFIQRERKRMGATFAQTVVFGFLCNQKATLSELSLSPTAAGLNILVRWGGIEWRGNLLRGCSNARSALTFNPNKGG